MEAVCGIRDIKLPICFRILFYYSKNDQYKKKNTSKEGEVE